MSFIEIPAALAEERSSVADGPGSAPFAPVLRKDLFRAVQRIRRDLGLTPQDLRVFDALLSFLPARDRRSGRDLPVGPDMLLVVFASNASIQARACDIDDRVLRRHIARLAGAGLLRRRDSASGKRFPLRRGGGVRDAFGLDLRPAFLHAPEILARATAAEAEDAALATLRAEVQGLRRALLDRTPAELAEWLDALPRMLRRKLSAGDLTAMRDRLAMALDERRRDGESAADGQIVRHTEPEQDPDHGKTDDLPHLGRYLPVARLLSGSDRDLAAALSTLTRLSPAELGDLLRQHGRGRVLGAFDRMIAKIADLACPEAFLRSLLPRLPAGNPVASPATAGQPAPDRRQILPRPRSAPWGRAGAEGARDAW